MLTLFRINSVLQFLLVVVVFTGLRVLYFTYGVPLLLDDILYITIGQKLSEGFSLYKELMVSASPLTSYVYLLIYNIFLDNQSAYQIFAAILTLIQIILFSNLIQKRNLLNDFTYIPAIVFTLLTFLSFDFLKLSPPLIANIFVILGVKNILKQMSKSENIKDDVFEGSLFFGLATLFHHSAFVFIIWGIFVLGIYTSISLRQGLMMIIGWLLPILFVSLIYYFGGSQEAYFDLWLFNFNKFVWVSILSIKDILITFSIPVIFSILGIFKVFSEVRFNSFQNRSHQALILFGFFAIFAYLISGKFTPANLYYFIIPLAFYIAAFFQLSKKIILPEILFLIFTASILFVSIIGFNQVLGFTTNALADEKINVDPEGIKYPDKRLFVTGRDISAYKDNPAATGYLDWKLARKDFENFNNFLNISRLRKNFNRDLPEIIIDHEELMPEIFEKIPSLNEKYKIIEKNTYKLVN